MDIVGLNQTFSEAFMAEELLASVRSKYKELSQFLTQYDIHAAAASVNVYAVKPNASH